MARGRMNHRIRSSIQAAGGRESQYRPLSQSQSSTNALPPEVPSRVVYQDFEEADVTDFEPTEFGTLNGNQNSGLSEWNLRTQAASDNWDQLRPELYKYLLRKDDELPVCQCWSQCSVTIDCISLRGIDCFIVLSLLEFFGT
jgi:hypothetical protein